MKVNANVILKYLNSPLFLAISLNYKRWYKKMLYDCASLCYAYFVVFNYALDRRDVDPDPVGSWYVGRARIQFFSPLCLIRVCFLGHEGNANIQIPREAGKKERFF